MRKSEEIDQQSGVWKNKQIEYIIHLTIFWGTTPKNVTEREKYLKESIAF